MAEVKGKRPLTLTERLALERNVLANERTFLAVVRTGIALVGISVGFLVFVDHHLAAPAAWTLLMAAIVTAVFGILRYLRLRRRLAELESGHVD